MDPHRRRRVDRGECLCAPPRDNQACRATSRSEEETLGEKEAHESPTASPEGDAYRDLPASRHCTAEKQVCHVDAGNDEHERGSREQNVERQSHRRCHAQFVERSRPSAPRSGARSVRLWKTANRIRTTHGRRGRHHRAKRGHAIFGGLNRDPGLPARNEIEVARFSIIELGGRAYRNGNEEVCPAADPAESGRGHSYNWVFLPFQIDRRTKCTSISCKPPLPKVV